MNYLAHLFLSGQDNGLICGNFLADFIKNSEVVQLPEPIQLGVKLHRLIDTYTDSHPVMRESNKVLHPYFHKYAPVVSDMYCDYLLGKHWETFSSEGLSDFLTRIYGQLLIGIDSMPDRIQSRTKQMISHNWLQSYTAIQGLGYAFMRMTERVNFPMDFSKAPKILLENELVLESYFLEFFPNLLAEVQSFIEANLTPN